MLIHRITNQSGLETDRLRRWIFWACGLLVLFWITPELWARLGGGGGYSGGGGGGGGYSGGGGGGGGDGAEIIFIWIEFSFRYPLCGIPGNLLLFYIMYKMYLDQQESTVIARQPVAPPNWDTLRQLDANFSEVLFRDFGYS